MTYHVEDNFLEDFESFREACDGLSYNGMVNPGDGVFYPGVTDQIPEETKTEVKARIESLLGFEVKINVMFLRLSVKGVHCPHQAHTDSTLGKIGFMFYANRLEDCIGGTSFIIHKHSGLQRDPINEKQQKVWDEDHNNTDAWQIKEMIDMKPNRGFLFDVSLMHRSMPVGGFGDDRKTGRLAMIAFLDKA